MSGELVKQVTSRAEDIIALAFTFFCLKHRRRVCMQPDFLDLATEALPDDPEKLQVLTRIFGIRNKLIADVEGNAGFAVAVHIVDHPQKKRLAGNLADGEIHNICSDLDRDFEEQEIVELCHESSYFFDAGDRPLSSIDFALHATINILHDCSKGTLGMQWFADMKLYKDREQIVMAVIASRFPELCQFEPLALPEKT